MTASPQLTNIVFWLYQKALQTRPASKSPVILSRFLDAASSDRASRLPRFDNHTIAKPPCLIFLLADCAQSVSRHSSPFDWAISSPPTTNLWGYLSLLTLPHSPLLNMADNHRQNGIGFG